MANPHTPDPTHPQINQISDKYAETAKWSFTETYMYGSGKVR